MLGRTSHFIKVPYHNGTRSIVIHMNQNNGLYDIYYGTDSRDTYPLEKDLRSSILNIYKGRQVSMELVTDILRMITNYFKTIKNNEKSF